HGEARELGGGKQLCARDAGAERDGRGHRTERAEARLAEQRIATRGLERGERELGEAGEQWEGGPRDEREPRSPCEPLRQRLYGAEQRRQPDERRDHRRPEALAQ